MGALVVYASHGIGRITSREARDTREGRHEVVVIEFAGGLSVTLPVERAREYMRPLSGEAEIAVVQAALRGVESSQDENWQRRFKATRQKIAAGDAVGLAEIVRDGLLRQQRLSSRGTAVLSSSERQFYLKARQLLAEEVSAVRGVEPAEADAWIGAQVASSPEEEPSP